MQKKKYLILLLFALTGAGIWHQKSQKGHEASFSALDESTAGDENRSHQETIKTTSLASSAPASSSSAATTSAKISTGKELSSLEDMSRTLAQFTRPESRLNDLVQYLDSSRQQPQVLRDSNADTGDMVIVRTKSPLPGTRYFHAQYFADENNRSYVQHMSFEYKPGPTAMKDAIQAVQDAFPDLPSPKVQKQDFVQWEAPGGYVLWIKKMDSKDLQDDPFNAYSKDDVGTVRVAMELEIHGNEDSHHH